MAKLVGPLFSLEARGKIGEAIVFFPWKGRNVARAYCVPSNPRDIDQKLVRQKLAAAGKNLKAIETPKTGLVNGSSLYQTIKTATTPATQIWNAFFVKTILEHVKTDSNFTALSAALFGVGETALTAWVDVAAELGFEDLTGPAYATTISPELQLFMGAYGAYDLSLSGDFINMSVYPTNLDAADISNFGSEYQTTT